MFRLRSIRSALRTAARIEPGNSVQILATSKISRRWLNLHEHVAFTLMQKTGVPVPVFAVASSPDEAVLASQKLQQSGKVVLKAQVLTGGRGKGTWKNGLQGGVKLVHINDVKTTAEQMIGGVLVTKQTGDKGVRCSQVLIAEPTPPKKEAYLAILMEGESNGPVVVYSTMGGMNIEDVAKSHPTAIQKIPIDILDGMEEADAEKIVKDIGVAADKIPATINSILNLYKMFEEADLTMLEINPFAEITSGDWLCLDAKLRVDDDALFRQTEILKTRDYSQEDPKEMQAAKFKLNYIALDGNIACLVNGAGLAMATMDIVKLNGGEPANFLDVGGSASAQQISEAFRILTADPKVKVIFVNIFGGIMRCDLIAQGIIDAKKSMDIKVPTVVRLQGTNVDQARDLLNQSGLDIKAQHDFDEAARQAVLLAKGVTVGRPPKKHLEITFQINQIN